MFGIGMTEMLVIAVIALVVLGPKRLPELARTLGKTLAEFRRSATDLRREFSDVMDENRIDPPIRLPAKSEPEPPSAPASEARSEAEPSEGRTASEERARGPAKASEGRSEPEPGERGGTSGG